MQHNPLISICCSRRRVPVTGSYFLWDQYILCHRSRSETIPRQHFRIPDFLTSYDVLSLDEHEKKRDRGVCDSGTIFWRSILRYEGDPLSPPVGEAAQGEHPLDLLSTFPVFPENFLPILQIYQIFRNVPQMNRGTPKTPVR
jgi:hypothetical protein